MITYKILLIVLLSVVVPVTVIAQDTLSLDQCLTYGQQRNLLLKQTRMETRLDFPSDMMAYGVYLPSVSFNFGLNQSNFYTRTFENLDGTVGTLYQPITGKRRTSGFSFDFQQILFVGGRNYLGLKNNTLNRQVRHLQVEAAQFNIRYAVTVAYCELVGAERSLEVANTLVEQRQLQFEAAQVRFQTGTVTKRDVMQAEVDLGRARNDSLNTTLQVFQTREALNILLDIPLETTYVITGLPILFYPKWDVDSLIRVALQQQPALRTTRLQSKLLQNNYLSSLADHLPMVTASISHRRSEQSGATAPFTLSPRNYSNDYGLTATWLMFGQFSKNYNRQETKLRKRQNEIELIRQEQELRRLVNNKVHQLQSFSLQYQVAGKNSELAKETLWFEQERYRLGSGTVMDLGAAQVSYVESQRERIALELQFHIILSELENTVGLELRSPTVGFLP